MSMPYIGLIPFLLKGISVLSQSVMIVSMPYIGLIPFLHHGSRPEGSGQRLCQCPTSGLSHFYIPVIFDQYAEYICVNALHRAYPISTEAVKVIAPEKDVCVNALHRAYPISTRRLQLRSLAWSSVSMPYIGLIPFLQN